jgi:hypothetical protein
LPRARSASSTASTIVRVWRSVAPEQITKKSVITISSPTSRTRMSFACLSSAARAAAIAISRGSSRLPVSADVRRFVRA